MRKRVFAPTAKAIGIPSPRAYDLRHSFASLRIHEGRLSIVELAEQLGDNPTMCLSTYAHVMAEIRGAPKVSAEEEIEAARAAVNGSRESGCGPNAAQLPIPGQLSLEDLGLDREADGRTRTGDPFITSVCRARDVGVVAGMDRYKVPAQRRLVGDPGGRRSLRCARWCVPATYFRPKMSRRRPGPRKTSAERPTHGVSLAGVSTCRYG
jgi:hypothetical protein